MQMDMQAESICIELPLKIQSLLLIIRANCNFYAIALFACMGMTMGSDIRKVLYIHKLQFPNIGYLSKNVIYKNVYKNGTLIPTFLNLN